MAGVEAPASFQVALEAASTSQSRAERTVAAEKPPAAPKKHTTPSGPEKAKSSHGKAHHQTKADAAAPVATEEEMLAEASVAAADNEETLPEETEPESGPAPEASADSKSDDATTQVAPEAMPVVLVASPPDISAAPVQEAAVDVALAKQPESLTALQTQVATNRPSTLAEAAHTSADPSAASKRRAGGTDPPEAKGDEKIPGEPNDPPAPQSPAPKATPAAEIVPPSVSEELPSATRPAIQTPVAPAPGPVHTPTRSAHEKDSDSNTAAVQTASVPPQAAAAAPADAAMLQATSTPAPAPPPAEESSTAKRETPIVATAPQALQPSAHRAEVAAPAQDSPAPDAQNTFDQVVLGLRGKFDPRAGKAEIRLDPPNLGSVKVSVTLDNGTLTAEFQSSSELVRGLLKDNMEKLKSVLETRGVAVDRLAVEAPRDAVTSAPAGQQQNAFGDASHDGRSAGQHDGRQDPRHGNRRAPEGAFAALFRQSHGSGGSAAKPVDLVA
jgi:flagellar hook-length control protein FliK